jgi:hypothetical protein
MELTEILSWIEHISYSKIKATYMELSASQNSNL